MTAAQCRPRGRAWAWSVLVVSPERIGPTDDGGGRQRPEIPTIEGVRGPPVHQEDLSGGDEAAALPDRQRTPETIPVERVADREAIDDDCPLDAADGLTRKSEDALQERHAFGQVAALMEKGRERFGRRDDER